jgi:hypothetical protein
MSLLLSKDHGHSTTVRDEEGHQKLLNHGEEFDSDECYVARLLRCSKWRQFTKWIPLVWFRGLFVCGSLLLLGFSAGWNIAVLPKTNLREEIHTVDNKSFPSGRLTWSQHFNPVPCGRNPSEAVARGCQFDIIATAWLPSDCIDFELADEFVKVHPWNYYPDPNRTDTFPTEPNVLGAQTGIIYTTHRWHVAHCLYMWKKLNRALINGWKTDAETVQQGHTDHCSMAALDTEDMDAVRSIMEIIYPPC